MKKTFDLEVKRKIYNLIKKNPGVNTSKISEIIGVSWELVNYHLLYLEKNEMINIVKQEGYSRCFISGSIGEQDRKILSVLRQKHPLAIVLFLLLNPMKRFKEISVNFDIAPSTLSYHIDKLVKKDIVEFITIENTKLYKVKNEKYISKLLISYKPASLVDEYEDMWNEFLWNKNLFKKKP